MATRIKSIYVRFKAYDFGSIDLYKAIHEKMPRFKSVAGRVWDSLNTEEGDRVIFDSTRGYWMHFQRHDIWYAFDIRKPIKIRKEVEGNEFIVGLLKGVRE